MGGSSTFFKRQYRKSDLIDDSNQKLHDVSSRVHSRCRIVSIIPIETTLLVIVEVYDVALTWCRLKPSSNTGLFFPDNPIQIGTGYLFSIIILHPHNETIVLFYAISFVNYVIMYYTSTQYYYLNLIYILQRLFLPYHNPILVQWLQVAPLTLTWHCYGGNISSIVRTNVNL